MRVHSFFFFGSNRTALKSNIFFDRCIYMYLIVIFDFFYIHSNICKCWIKQLPLQGDRILVFQLSPKVWSYLPEQRLESSVPIFITEIFLPSRSPIFLQVARRLGWVLGPKYTNSCCWCRLLLNWASYRCGMCFILNACLNVQTSSKIRKGMERNAVDLWARWRRRRREGQGRG